VNLDIDRFNNELRINCQSIKNCNQLIALAYAMVYQKVLGLALLTKKFITYLRKHVVVGEKLTNEACLVTVCIVVVENPILCAPQIQSLSPNVLPQTAQNFAVKLCVDGLALGDEFMMNDAVNVKKHNARGLH
jgi:hypothetical protein